MNFSHFKLEWRSTFLCGDILQAKGEHPRASSTPNLFILHGAGMSQRSNYQTFRKTLAEFGVSSAAFDFVGHGETGGKLEGSSLKDRTEQAMLILNHFGRQPPVAIFASSMSAYTALKCLRQVPVHTLILTVPAAYDQSAYETPFGPEFTAKIRSPRSWEKSDAWELLSDFKGQLLIVRAEADTVIPREIPERLIESSAAAKSRKLITIEDAPHSILKYLVEFPERYRELVKEISETTHLGVQGSNQQIFEIAARL